MPKSDERDERIRAGLRRLEELGLGEEASVADLERTLATAPETGVAVASRLGEVVAEESLRALRSIERDAVARGDKALRREARRSLYRLSQKGLRVDDGRPASTEAPAAVFAAPEPEGYLSPPDTAGDRLLWILKPRSGGGLYHLSAIVNEPAGLREAVLSEVSRRTIRELLSEIQQRHRVTLVPIDWRYCDWIASEGYERARARDGLPESASQFPQLRLQLFSFAAEPVAPPIDFVLPSNSSDEGALASSDSLLEEEDFRYWTLPESELAPYLARVQEMRQSPIVLDRFQQTSRVEEIIGDALRGLFSGEAARSWRRRLEELAYILWETGRREPAKRAAAAGRALEGRAGGGQGIPFFETLVRRSFAVHFGREAEKEREEKAGSVIVTPDQLREQQARSRRSPRSPK